MPGQEKPKEGVRVKTCVTLGPLARRRLRRTLAVASAVFVEPIEYTEQWSWFSSRFEVTGSPQVVGLLMDLTIWRAMGIR